MPTFKLTRIAVAAAILSHGFLSAQTIDQPSSDQTALGFIPNKGQIANEKAEVLDSIDFKFESPGVNGYITPGGIVYHFYREEEKAYSELTDEERKAYERGDFNEVGKKVFFTRLDFQLIDADYNAEITTGNETVVQRNYYLPQCLDGITNVPTYRSIIYKDIYPNIDLKYAFVNGQLKYDFIVHPGADVSDIKIRYAGAEKTTLSGKELSISNTHASLTEKAPVSFYSESNEAIRSEFVVDNDVIGFKLEDYDPSQPITIDPSVTWATYYTNGGSSSFHSNSAFDSNENIFIAYSTYSATWTTINAGAGQYYDNTKDGSNDLIVMRVNSDYSVQWITYYGSDANDVLCGTGGDYGKTIDVDANDDVYVGGRMYSNPTVVPTLQSSTPGAWYQDAGDIKGGDNPFIAKFDGNGVLQWATLYQHTDPSTSGAGMDINGIKCNGTKVYFTGETYGFSGYDIPLVSLAGAYNNSTFVGSQDIYLARLSAGCVLEWSTYFNGGNASLDAYKQGADITFDPSGNMILVGQISGTDPGSGYLLDPGGTAYYNGTISGSIDIIISKFNTSMQPVWSTYFGSPELDRVSEVSTDDNGNILIACRTIGGNGMPTQDPGGAFYYSTKQSPGTWSADFSQDGAVLKFNPSGTYYWGTYVGGTNEETNSITGVSSDASGNIYAIGYTYTTDFPTTSLAGSYNQSSNGGALGTGDIVLMKFTSGGVNEWSTYYGGSNTESCYGRKIDVSSTGSVCGYKQFFSGTVNGGGYPCTDPGAPAHFENPASPPGSANVWLLIEESGGATSTAPSSITVNQPSPCAGQNVTLSVSGGSLASGDSWVWYQGGCGSGASIGTGSSIIVAPTSNTTYYVRAEGPCGNTTCVSTTVSVTGTGTENPSWTSPGTICEAAGSLNLDSYVTGDPGGTWSGTGVTGSTFDPTGLSGGISVTYSVGTSPCEATETHTITVNPDVDPVWSTPGTICEAGGIVDLTTYLGTATAGGTWSGTGVSGSNFDPAGLSGSISITYTVGTAPCQETSTQAITVNPDVDPSWNDPSPVCESAGSINLSGLVTGTSGGTWSGTGVSGTTFDPTGLSGTVNITYTVGTAPCQETSTIGVTVTATPDPSWTSPGTICEANGTIDLSTTITGTTGGTFSGTGVTSPNFDPSGLTGSVSITYTVGSGSCQQSSTQTINVVSDVDPSWTTPGTVCEGDGSVNLNGLITGTPGGTWSGTGVTSSTFDPSGLSGQTISITYTVGTSPCVETLTQGITVQSSVTASWNNPGTICANDGPIDLTTYITGTTGGTFSGTGVSGNMFDPTGLSGSYTITYSVGTAPCDDSQNNSINVIPDVDPSWTNPSPVCVSSGSIDLNTLVTGTTGGTWSGTGVTGSTFDPSGLGGQTILITYLVGTAPCQEQSVQSVAVTNSVSATWSAPADICESDSIADLNALVTGDLGGTWSGSGVSGSTFNPVGLSGSISITYTVGTAPCTDSQTSSINVLSAPTAPTVSVTNDTICLGDSVTISASGSGAGVTYDIYDAMTGGNLLGSTPMTIAPGATDTYYIEAVNSNNCANVGGRQAVEVVVNPLPVADAGSDQSLCPGDSVTLTASGGGSYLWSTSGTTASITVSPSTGTYYYVTVTTNGCSAMDSVFVDVLSDSSIIAVDDYAQTTSGTTYIADVISNDTGNPGNISILNGPYNGSATMGAVAISYISDPDFQGTDSLQYVICDVACTQLCDTATLYIEVTGEEDVVFHNAVTPNGDGINDAFIISGISQLTDTKLQIFTRWGDLIYEASPYNNDWKGESQRATYGDRVVDGTYFYVFTYTDSNGETHTKNGYVEVKSK